MTDYDKENWTPSMLVERCEKLESENAKLRGLIVTVIDADESNGHDVGKSDRELRLPKAWINEAGKAVTDDN